MCVSEKRQIGDEKNAHTTQERGIKNFLNGMEWAEGNVCKQAAGATTTAARKASRR